jgi:hypothetical protein
LQTAVSHVSSSWHSKCKRDSHRHPQMIKLYANRMLACRALSSAHPMLSLLDYCCAADCTSFIEYGFSCLIVLLLYVLLVLQRNAVALCCELVTIAVISMPFTRGPAHHVWHR